MAEQHPDQEQISEEELTEAGALADALETGSGRRLSDSGLEGAALLRVAASPRLNAQVQEQQRRELEALVGEAAERRDEPRASSVRAGWARWWLWLAPGLGAAALWVLFMRGPVESQLKATGSEPLSASKEEVGPLDGEGHLTPNNFSSGPGIHKDIAMERAQERAVAEQAEAIAAEQARLGPPVVGAPAPRALAQASGPRSRAAKPARRKLAKARGSRSRSASGAGAEPLGAGFGDELAESKRRRAQAAPRAIAPAVSEPSDLVSAQRTGGAVGQAPAPSRALLVAQLATLRGDRGARPGYARHLRNYRWRLLTSLEKP